MDISVLIVSCDAYEDAWEPFFNNFYRQWPNCPYPIYLQTNHLKPTFSNVNVLAVGDDIDWSTNLINAVKKIPTNKVLILLEDFWLWQPVKTKDIERLVNCMNKMKAAYLRLVPKPPGDKPLLGWPGVGEISKGQNYRVSFQAGLWQVNNLINVLRQGESAWQAETMGSLRSHDKMEPFLSVLQLADEEWPIRYLNAIIKQKWTPEAVMAAKRLKIELNLTKRPVCNWYDQLRRKQVVRKILGWVALLAKNILGRRFYSQLKANPIIKKIVY